MISSARTSATKETQSHRIPLFWSLQGLTKSRAKSTAGPTESIANWSERGLRSACGQTSIHRTVLRRCEVSGASPNQDDSVRHARFSQRFRAIDGRARDLMCRGSGRVESTGCVTSGRRWHRRIPPFVSRVGAALSRSHDENPVPRRRRRCARRDHDPAVRCRCAAPTSPISSATPAVTRTAPSASTASSPARGGFRSCRSGFTRWTMGRAK